MFCQFCGKQLPDAAKFCPFCGNKLAGAEPAKPVCPTCGTQLQPGQLFCHECGTKTGTASGPTPTPDPIPAAGPTPEPAPGPIPTPPPAPDPAPAPHKSGSGQLLHTMKMASLYAGEPKVGLAKATGTLNIYDDRLEFHKKLGSSAGAMFGLVGMGVARSQAKKDPVETYPLSQVAQCRLGKYGGVYNTLVAVMKDGTVVSFCPAVPGSSEPKSILELLTPYLG